MIDRASQIRLSPVPGLTVPSICPVTQPTSRCVPCVHAPHAASACGRRSGRVRTVGLDRAARTLPARRPRDHRGVRRLPGAARRHRHRRRQGVVRDLQQHRSPGRSQGPHGHAQPARWLEREVAHDDRGRRSRPASTSRSATRRRIWCRRTSTTATAPTSATSTTPTAASSRSTCGDAEIDSAIYDGVKVGHSRELARRAAARLHAQRRSRELVPGQRHRVRDRQLRHARRGERLPPVVVGACNDGGTMRDTVAPAVGDLVITEVMPKPAKVSDTTGEWFEVKAIAGRRPQRRRARSRGRQQRQARGHHVARLRPRHRRELRGVREERPTRR